MSNNNLREYHRLFDRWIGHHNWQDYDTQKAFYPSYEQFMEWWDHIDFRVYNLKDNHIQVSWSIAKHKGFKKKDINTDYLLELRDAKWFDLYRKVQNSDQYTLDSTIKTMISLAQHGPLAKCNLRSNGKYNINKGAKLSWACWLLDIECPMVVALPKGEADTIKELQGLKYKTIEQPYQLRDVYSEPSRAVLLPLTYGEGLPNIDCWTIHPGWVSYKDYGHTEFPDLDWDKFFRLLWDWARPYEPDFFTMWHNESKQQRLIPVFPCEHNEWVEFWKLCANKDLIIERPANRIPKHVF